MAKLKSRFSLKQKLIFLIVSIIVLIILLSGLFLFLGLTNLNRTQYITRSQQLSATAAATVDPARVRAVRDRVLEVFRATPEDERVSTEDWGSPEFDAYLARYSDIQESEDFRILRSQLQTIKDANALQSVYLLCFDLTSGSTVYLVDASEEECLPGCFDAVMYDVDRAAVADPAQGIRADVTNTPEYGWVVAAGTAVFLDDEPVVFAGADINMNDAVAQRNHFLLLALLALLALAVLAIAASILLIDRTIVRPINLLSDTSEKYWSGGGTAIRHDFSQIQIHTGDEIEALSNSMKQMEQNINDHISKILETTQTLISTRERADEMDRAANVDALTRLRNKRAYDLEVERLERDVRAGKTAVGLAMIDMNLLKQTNDVYGHEQGNAALRTLSRAICTVFQHSPVFRVGGDEFVVVLENEDYANIAALQAQFEQEMQRLASVPNPWERVSAAMGYALFDPAVDSGMESVFQRADQQMYEKKKAMKAQRE